MAGSQNWRRKTAQTEDWQQRHLVSVYVRFRHLLSAFGISWVLILLGPQLRPGSLINRILILILNFGFKVNSELASVRRVIYVPLPEPEPHLLIPLFRTPFFSLCRVFDIGSPSYSLSFMNLPRFGGLTLCN